jgi:chaperone BCS1
MYPAHIPMDNKLGILLYGPPGTGKTGTISAIANMLRRSIVVVNFTNITTCAQMDEILTPENYKKYVYVFDEFDCVLDVISGAPRPEANKTGTDWGSALLFAEGEERSKILTMMKEGRTRKADTPIDMAYLLQKLDGLESAEGRIIIATTNNPDKINPALLRPGRFDIKICLDLCTPNMVVDILANYYENDIEIRKKIVGANIVGNKYSPLELVNRAIQATDVDTLLKQLKE